MWEFASRVCSNVSLLSGHVPGNWQIVVTPLLKKPGPDLDLKKSVLCNLSLIFKRKMLQTFGFISTGSCSHW